MKQIENNAVSDLSVSYGTHAGMVGKNNEDFVAFSAFDSGIVEDEKSLIFHLGIVADGVGGQTAGERASLLATQTIIDYFSNIESISIDDIGEHFEQAVSIANSAVITEARESSEFRGMATTIAIVAILDGLLFTAHIGDSRIYLHRGGNLYQLTKDHSWVQEALQAGIISENEARVHPNRNIIRRSLGTIETVEVDRTMLSGDSEHFWQGMPLRKDDLILICSDGLSDMITDFDIQLSLQTEHNELPDLVVELIDKANQAGGRDNISIMVITPAPDFKPNRMMPIPPSKEFVLRSNTRRPEPEQITLVGQTIKSNSIAPVTVRSFPKVTRDMISAYDHDRRISDEIMPPVKSRTQFGNGQLKRPAQARSSSTVETAKIKRNPTLASPSVRTSTKSDMLQVMVRIVFGLTVVALLLAIIVYFSGGLSF